MHLRSDPSPAAHQLAMARSDQPQAAPDDLTARFLGWLPDDA
ncbi:hypothetical protein [Plantactinospora mayteni]|nr:hypothetical protein [Plantactinospora mayteni]